MKIKFKKVDKSAKAYGKFRFHFNMLNERGYVCFFVFAIIIDWYDLRSFFIGK